MPPLSFNPFQQQIWPNLGSKPADAQVNRRPAGPAREQIGASDSLPPSPPPPPAAGAKTSSQSSSGEQAPDRVYQEILNQQTTADFWIQQMGLNPF